MAKTSQFPGQFGAAEYLAAPSLVDLVQVADGRANRYSIAFATDNPAVPVIVTTRPDATAGGFLISPGGYVLFKLSDFPGLVNAAWYVLPTLGPVTLTVAETWQING